MQTRREGPRHSPPREGRGKGEALGVQGGSPLPISTSTQNLLVVLSGSVQGKREGARPPTLDTASPMAHRHEKSTGPHLAEPQRDGFGGPALPTGLRVRIRPGSNRQRRRQDSRTPARGQAGEDEPLHLPNPPPAGQGRTGTNSHGRQHSAARQDTARRATEPHGPGLTPIFGFKGGLGQGMSWCGSPPLHPGRGRGSLTAFGRCCPST